MAMGRPLGCSGLPDGSDEVENDQTLEMLELMLDKKEEAEAAREVATV